MYRDVIFRKTYIFDTINREMQTYRYYFSWVIEIFGTAYLSLVSDSGNIIVIAVPGYSSNEISKHFIQHAQCMIFYSFTSHCSKEFCGSLIDPPNLLVSVFSVVCLCFDVSRTYSVDSKKRNSSSERRQEGTITWGPFFRRWSWRGIRSELPDTARRACIQPFIGFVNFATGYVITERAKTP